MAHRARAAFAARMRKAEGEIPAISLTGEPSFSKLILTWWYRVPAYKSLYAALTDPVPIDKLAKLGTSPPRFNQLTNCRFAESISYAFRYRRLRGSSWAALSIFKGIWILPCQLSGSATRTVVFDEHRPLGSETIDRADAPSVS